MYIFCRSLQLCADTDARSRTKRKPLNDASLEKGIIFCHPLVCVFYVNKTNGWQVFAGSRIKIYFMRAQWRREKRCAELESAQPSCAANTHKQKIAPPHITPLLTFSKHACAPLLAFGLMHFIYVLRNACMSLCRRLKCRGVEKKGEWMFSAQPQNACSAPFPRLKVPGLVLPSPWNKVHQNRCKMTFH